MKKTICGAEAPSGEVGVIHVCTREQGHKGNHREAPTKYEWPVYEAPPEVPLAKDPEQVREDEPKKTAKPREVVFSDGLVATENHETVRVEVAPDKLLIDKLLFARAVKAIVQGMQGAGAYRGRAGITRFGIIMGGKNQKEQEELYRACLEAVRDDNKLQKESKG